jgi:hypothetical protein
MISVFFFFETESQDGLELVILLPLLHKCWDLQACTSPAMVSISYCFLSSTYFELNFSSYSSAVKGGWACWFKTFLVSQHQR